LKRVLQGGAVLFVLVCVGLSVWWLRSSRLPRFNITYQAVLTDNGFVYYGKIVGTSGGFAEMTDVYYIQNQVDPQTKEVKNILVRRGNELHAPDRTLINIRHIVMIEPVTAASKVAASIAAFRNKNP
jgi:hypothetical protein